jgi:hypothetical protein
MGDRSKCGMAKSIFASVGADGLDVTNPDALEGLLAEFNARPEEDRRRVLDGTVQAASRPPVAPTPPKLPPVAQPSDSEVADSKVAAPILAMFAGVAQFVGQLRPQTHPDRQPHPHRRPDPCRTAGNGRRRGPKNR